MGSEAVLVAPEFNSGTGDEANLVEKAKTNEQAFTVLYDRYFPKIYVFVFRRTGNKEVTEDLVSAIFEKVFLNLAGFRQEKGTFQAWVYRIAGNQIIDHFRKEKRVVVLEPATLAEITEPEEVSAENAVVKKENAESVRRVLALLPERYQHVLALRYFSELSNLEIAEALNISANGAGVLLHRALACFQKKYNEYVVKN